jgi:hypothetical protein
VHERVKLQFSDGDAPLRGERRRFPRVNVRDHLVGESGAAATAVRVVDLSGDGFLVESPMPFDFDSEHQFRLHMANGPDITVAAKALHSRLASEESGPSIYLTGFVVTGPDQWRGRLPFDGLIDAMMATLLQR